MRKEDGVGFWDWLTGRPKNIEVANDVIWMNQAAKLRGLRAAVREELDNARFVLVLAHFPNTLTQLKAALEEQGLPCLGAGDRVSAAELLRHEPTSGESAVLALAESLVPEPFPDPVDELASRVPILVGERHFRRAHDERISAFARGLKRRCRITFHLSLHDPLMRLFAGEWVGDVLRRLGMQDNEPVESRMVARRIKGAQAKFARPISPDRSANSAEEWLELNASGMTG
jgi:hypothetical protein